MIEDAIDDVTPLAESKAITIAVDSSAAPDVACDRGVLTSILVNLLRNAVEYMGEPLRVRARQAW